MFKGLDFNKFIFYRNRINIHLNNIHEKSVNFDKQKAKKKTFAFDKHIKVCQGKPIRINATK